MKAESTKLVQSKDSELFDGSSKSQPGADGWKQLRSSATEVGGGPRSAERLDHNCPLYVAAIFVLSSKIYIRL